MTVNAPLSGIRVLDLTWVLAGPTGATLLAMLGAEVIKVESRMRPDGGRRAALSAANPPNAVATPLMPGFHNTNHSKLAITVNLKNGKGVELLRRLVAISDVIMESFTPGTMARLGLGYEELRMINPNLIMLSISGSGQKGPESQYASYAAIASALGGLAHLTSYPGGVPTEYRGSFDLRTGVIAVFAVLAALWHRTKTGQGQHVDLAAREAVSCYMGEAIMDYTMNGRVRGPVGNQDEIMSPHGVYRCRPDSRPVSLYKGLRGEDPAIADGRPLDRWVSIAVGSDEEWRNLCAAIGRPELADDPRFADAYLRRQNQQELDAIISEWTGRHTDYEVMHRLQAVGVAAVPSFSTDQLYNDPHLIARDLLASTRLPNSQQITLMKLPWKMNKTPGHEPTAAPGLGEHNDYVFGKLLRMSPPEIEALVEEGAIQ